MAFMSVYLISKRLKVSFITLSYRAHWLTGDKEKRKSAAANCNRAWVPVKRSLTVQIRSTVHAFSGFNPERCGK